MEKLLRTLMRHRSDLSIVNLQDDEETAVDGASGYTALHEAAFHDNNEAVAVLLKHGADPRARDRKYCATPAGWAAYAGHMETANLILDADIDVFDAIDFDRADRVANILDRDPGAIDRPFRAYASCKSKEGQWWPAPDSTPIEWTTARQKLNAVGPLTERGAGARTPDDFERAQRVVTFLQSGCWDHHVHGKGDHRMYDGRPSASSQRIRRSCQASRVVPGAAWTRAAELVVTHRSMYVAYPPTRRTPMSRSGIALIGLLLGFFALAVPANAQPLGSFRWQLQPYCNILTVNVVQQGGIYTLDGTDDRCGATQAASVVGLAFLNPSGLVGFGLTTVLPGGTPIHVEATINMTSLNGTWRDSAGNIGTMIFTPGPGIGGSPRPVPSGGVAPGSITSVQIASGAVGNTQLAADSISGANVVDGSLSIADLADAPKTAAVEVSNVALTVADTVVAEVTIAAPAAGRIIANASGYFYMTNGATLDTGRCVITTGLTVTGPLIYAREYAATSYYGIPFAGTRAFSVAAGSSTTVRLVCDAFSGNVTVGTPDLNAFFIAGS